LLDGRKHHHARVAAVVAALTTIGLGFATASPAAAAPHDIDAVQAQVDRLSQQADAAEKRHENVRGSLNGARHQLDRLSKEIRHQRQVLDTLRAEVASSVTDLYTGSAGSSVPSRPTPSLSRDSEILLTNVTLVSEDTGGRGDAMATSNDQLQTLSDRRTAVRDQVTRLASLEQTLQERQRLVDTRVSRAGDRLESLEKQAEAKRLRELGGPVLAYAKSKVGNAYVYGAAGPSSFDCSGLTMMAWSQAGVSLPHSSSAQYSSGPHVSESELQPGDLVFYYSPISHVGLYIGDGKIVNALNPGAGVQISGLHDMPYVGAVRPG
jgi:cell wall-associated NlpC family hydrolase